MSRTGQRGEPFFKAEVGVEWDAVGVPSVTWHRAGFHDWSKRLPKHKPARRRRMTRDGLRATIGGIR